VFRPMRGWIGIGRYCGNALLEVVVITGFVEIYIAHFASKTIDFENTKVPQ
jgi:hypothetical protein